MISSPNQIYLRFISICLSMVKVASFAAMTGCQAGALRPVPIGATGAFDRQDRLLARLAGDWSGTIADDKRVLMYGRLTFRDAGKNSLIGKLRLSPTQMSVSDAKPVTVTAYSDESSGKVVCAFSDPAFGSRQVIAATIHGSANRLSGNVFVGFLKLRFMFCKAPNLSASADASQ